MEGLVNYGSDDETESPINAAERKNSMHYNKYKSRTSASSSSSSDVNIKDEGPSRGGYKNDRSYDKESLRSKESEKSAYKLKRDSREEHARDRDRMQQRQYRNTRDVDHSQRDRHERSERHYDNKSYNKDSKSDKDYSYHKQDRRRNDDRYDRHNRHREADSRSKQRYEVERERRDARRSKSPNTSQQTLLNRKRRYGKSRSKSPVNKREREKNREHDRDRERNSTETIVQKKTADVDVTTKELQTNKELPQLPKYYNPSVINPSKYAEQIQKRKLLWSGKKGDDNAGKWGTAQFSEDSDGKVASKFMRLMGIKNSAGGTEQPVAAPDVKSREEMFSSMEQQYEVARQATHTMRGVGLGFSSQSRLF